MTYLINAFIFICIPTGVNVLTTELEGNNGVATINLDNIPSGIYFYTVRSGDDVMTGKLVVE